MFSRARILILTVAAFVLVIALIPRIQRGKASAETGSFGLQKPSFIEATGTEAVAATGFPEDEVGIAAYFLSDITIDLDLVRDEFLTIETETADYIIGSVDVPNYGELEAAHVYVHVDGWVMAYYLWDEPVSKIVDIKNYDGITLNPSKLEQVLVVIASAAGSYIDQVKYYDFRYPNSNNMTIIAERGGEFDVNLTDQYVYAEESWTIYKYNTGQEVAFTLDGTRYHACNTYCYGEFSPNLTVNTIHTLQTGQGIAIVLEYRVP